MVLEQVLTIVFAVGIGAAVIIYAARPRHRGASLSVAASTLSSYSPVGVTHSEPMPQAAAVETIPEEIRAPAVVSPAVAEAAVTGRVEVAPAAAPIAAPAAPASVAETVEPAPHAAKGARRAQRKRSTPTKSRTRSSRTKKSQTRSE
jgi:cytoskeletal protein RodZ